MILLSVTGLFRMILIILGVMFLLSILGKMMQARRNVAEQKRLQEEVEANQRMVQNAQKNYGKTSIIGSKTDPSDSEFTDFEEVE